MSLIKKLGERGQHFLTRTEQNDQSINNKQIFLTRKNNRQK